MGKKAEVDDKSRAPKGHFVVYVGSEMRRFVIPTSFLKNPMFQQLLDKAAEESTFRRFTQDLANRLLLPCNESTFRRLIQDLAKQCS